jgi:DNA-binding TFAR19-related protein (PDSD5 family)
MGGGAAMKSTQEIIEELKRMECINYSHYSAPKICTKDARDRLEELLHIAREKSQQCDQALVELAKFIAAAGEAR